MSSINVDTRIEITVEEEEKEVLTKAYKILKELNREMHEEGFDDTEEEIQVWSTKYHLYELLHSYLKVDIEE